MARKNIFVDAPVVATPQPEPRPSPFASVEKSMNPIALMQSEMRNFIREIEPDLVDASAFHDRIPGQDPELDALVAAIREHGQLVPALVRPSPKERGRFEIVYGRRRLAAARELGIPLKAVVHQLDDLSSLIAQGFENNQRLQTSFIEKALFAYQLDLAGYSREVVVEVLSTHKTVVSRMIVIVGCLGVDLIRKIGPCHDLGRRRWSDLYEKVSHLVAKGVFDVHEVKITGETDIQRFEDFAAQVDGLIAAHSPEFNGTGPSEGDADGPDPDEPEAEQAGKGPDGDNRNKDDDRPSSPSFPEVRLTFRQTHDNIGSVRFQRSQTGMMLRFASKPGTEDFDAWFASHVDGILAQIKQQYESTREGHKIEQQKREGQM